MNASQWRRLSAIAVLWLALLPAVAITYGTGADRYVPVNYSTFLPPAVGVTYIDPVFGTPITRISDAMSTPNAASAGNLTRIAHEYSTISPFNHDSSKMVIGHESYWALYDGSGHYLKGLPFEIREPRWSRVDPDLLYYVAYGNQLKQYNIAADAGSLVHTFAEYTIITGLGESDISFDGNHFVLVGDFREIFVYEISSDTKGQILDAPALGSFDNVHITPSNNVLVSWYAGGTGRYQGIELYDRDMLFLRQVAQANGHVDVTRDTAGEDVLIYAGEGASPCTTGVVSIRLGDDQRVCMLSLNWTLAVHVSVPDNAAWAIVTTYALENVSPSDGWTAYTNEILQVRLDGSEVRRLAHHRSRSFNSYTWTPRAAISRDGSRLVYDSNYGLQSILGHPAEYSDVYLIDLDSLALAPPGSATALRTRFEQDDLSVLYRDTWFTSTHSLQSGGSAALSMEADARATFTFTGTAVRWIGYGDEWSGIADVYLDGELKATVDTFMSPARSQTVFFSTSGLSLGLHTLVIEVTGSHSSLSRGAWIWLDAFEIAVRFEQDGLATTYTGNWMTGTQAANSRSSAALTMDPGARATFSFIGTAVSWIGTRDEWSGIARVYIDDTLRAEIDTYATPSQYNDVIYTLAGLPRGPHTLVIEATQRKNPASSAPWVWVDGFEISP